MNVVNYILVLIVSFIGLFVGNIISLMSKEELKIGEKWFKILEKVIFVLILAVFLVYCVYTQKFVTLIIVLLLSVFFKFSKRENLENKFSGVHKYKFYEQLKFKESFVYLMLAVIFYFSSKSNIFIIIASLIFLYGIPIGSLITKELKKEVLIIKEILIKYMVFLVVGIILILFI